SHPLAVPSPPALSPTRGRQSACSLRLQLQPARMQCRFGVALGPFTPTEYEVASGLIGDGVVEVRRHRRIVRITGVLAVDDGGHALHGFVDLSFAGDAVV